MGVLDSISKSLNNVNKETKNASGKLFNSNPQQKSGKLGGIGQSITQISKTATGTVTGVGHTVAKIAGSIGGEMGSKIANFLEGSSSTKWYPEKPDNFEVTGLKAFYHRFKDQSNQDVNSIDPLNTFECTFTFYPDPEKDRVSKDSSSSFLQEVMEKKQLNTQPSPRFSYETNKENLEAIPSEKNLIDLGMFIQSITIPQIQQDNMEDIKTILGTFPVSGNFVQPDTKKLTMEIVNTKSSLHENFFYSWLKEVTLPVWSYNTQPYTTARIELDFSEHSNVKYVFYGCRPCSVQMLQPSQEA